MKLIELVALSMENPLGFGWMGQQFSIENGI